MAMIMVSRHLPITHPEKKTVQLDIAFGFWFVFKLLRKLSVPLWLARCLALVNSQSFILALNFCKWWVDSSRWDSTIWTCK